eukprot:TRINITY_DN7401_c0_g2_i1.p1 TRINITY_DN7401_c0_g2~~TRINITY_DN7401_c0_g2_i1.p1  ORF type:complete len:293 (+),score=61.17 TRINITY_DN7401_c0_g2_i1:804-1682(+)
MLRKKKEVLKCLQQCYSDKVYLSALAHRFLNLSLQLIARYTSWLREAATRGVTSRLDELPTWARTATHEDIVVAANDALIVAQFVENEYLQQVVLPTVTLDVNEVVEEAYNGVVSELQQAVAQILAPVIVSLCDKSNPILQQMKGITAMYRMTNRQPPSKPSLYVSKVLKTLESFITTNKVQNSSYAKQQIVYGVVDGLTKKFNDLANEHLGAIQKSEESLKRLKKAGPQLESGSSKEMSNLDKIGLQFFLDVKEHGRQISLQGMDPAQLGSYQELWRTVAPADQKEIIQIS